MKKRATEQNLIDLTRNGAVCVVMRTGESVSVVCYDANNRSPEGATIRTYVPGAVDARWDGPVLATAAEVLAHLGGSEEPCCVPVLLGKSLFNWTLPFAELPGSVRPSGQ